MPGAPGWQRLLWYAAYRKKARSSQYIHSPFLFSLMQAVFNDAPFSCPAENYRDQLLKDKHSIRVNDLGAGSRSGGGQERRVSDIARAALQRPKYARFLYRLCKYLQPGTVLELGTSFGITAQYLAAGAGEKADMITIEGNEATAAIALHGFEQSRLANVRLIRGGFDEVLPPLLQELPQLDFVFMDGNHRREPTLRYFSWMQPLFHSHTVVVVDDIYWSAEMQRAWKDLYTMPGVTLSVDMFQFGLLFFNTGLSREHFILRY